MCQDLVGVCGANQNAILSANWIWRDGRDVAEIVPTPVTPSVLPGSVNCGWLKVLKNSERNCR